MSGAEARKLFALVDDLARTVGGLVQEVTAMRAETKRAVSNTDLVLHGYQEHGTALEHIQRRMERLNIRCPLMKPETAELPKV